MWPFTYIFQPNDLTKLKITIYATYAIKNRSRIKKRFKSIMQMSYKTGPAVAKL